MAERTFLDPLKEADALLYSVRSDLIHIAGALDFLGNEALADKLREINAHVYAAQKAAQEGCDMALNGLVTSTDHATANMVRAAMAAASVKP